MQIESIPALARGLRGAGLPCFPCRQNKKPAISRGDSWKDASERPLEAHQWFCELVGVPVPPGVLIIDLDAYKGVTRDAVESELGCPLPWDAALIQTTQSGGQHYAFTVPREEQYPNGSNVRGVTGLDLRAAGKGYIATGDPYYRPVGMGIFRLSDPGALPPLPEPARAALRTRDPRVLAKDKSAPPIPSSTEISRIVEALHHVDPGADRSEWIQIGMALNAALPNESGLALFAAWSAGEFTESHAAPDNYDPSDIETQWNSFKPGKGISINTLFFRAIEGGWRPPSEFNMTSLFGQDAAPVEEYQAMVRRIREVGGNPVVAPEVIQEIQSGKFNTAQNRMLMAVLQSELKSAGLLTKDIKDMLTDRTKKESRPGRYGKNDTENALLFLQQLRENGGDLLRAHENLWQWTGTHWALIEGDVLSTQICREMVEESPSNGQIEGTASVLKKLVGAPRPPTGCPESVIVFRNACLDTDTFQTLPHRKDMGATYCLPYDWEPNAQCPRWVSFLREVFEDDEERANLLQEFLGYCMVRSYKYHKMLFMIGPTRAGKGTILRLTEKLIGSENFAGGSLDSLAQDYMIELIQNKSVMAVGDAPKRLNRFTQDRVIERLNSISGADKVPFNRKWKSGIELNIPCRMIIAANDYPQMFDESGALAGRMMPLPFNVTVAGRENPNLLAELVSELPGIAVWAVNGLRRLNQNRKFTIPRLSQEEKDDLEDTYAPLRVFVRDKCEPTESPENVVFTSELYAAYLEWCASLGESATMTSRVFSLALRSRLRGTVFRYGTHRRGEENKKGYRNMKLRPSTCATAPALEANTEKR